MNVERLCKMQCEWCCSRSSGDLECPTSVQRLLCGILDSYGHILGFPINYSFKSVRNIMEELQQYAFQKEPEVRRMFLFGQMRLKR